MNDDLVRAKNVVRVLDSLVTRQLREQPDLLAGWWRVKHPKAKTGVPQGTTLSAPDNSAAEIEPEVPAEEDTPAEFSPLPASPFSLLGARAA